MARPLIDGDVLDQTWRTSESIEPHIVRLVPSQWTTPNGASVYRADLLISHYGEVTPAIKALFPATEPVTPVGTRTPALLRFMPAEEWRTGLVNGRYFHVAAGERITASSPVFYSGKYEPIGAGVEHRFVLQFCDANGTYMTGVSSTQSPSGTTSTAEPRILELSTDVPEGAAGAELIWTLSFPAGDPIELSNVAFYLTDPKAVITGPAKGAVTEVGAATAERLGVISEVSARSKARFPLTLAELPEHFRSGESVEMAAAGRAASASVWRWRQVSGPPVTLERHGGLARFIAPDVSSPTPIRVAVMASSVDGASRSDWYFYDFTITPALARFRAAEELESVPTLPAIVGYERGKRRIWGDALPPPGMPGRKDTEIIDLGIPDGDVQISEEFPQSAPAGGLHINPVTGDVHRNFGGGYNESGDTLGAPRRSAYWLASEGNIFKWSED